MDTASHSISPEQLSALLGSADAPLVLDVRREQRFRESRTPAARRAALRARAGRGASPPPTAPRQVVVYCVHGLEVGQQAAAQLRAAGWDARYLQGGIEGLIEQGIPTIRKRPDLGVTGEQPSRWITRERPKIDRVACPWLVRRFIDPAAEFFYVPTEAGIRAGGPVEGGPLRHPRRADHARRGAVQLRYPAARVRPAGAGAATLSRPSCAAPTPTGSSWHRSRPGCWRCRWACRGSCTRTTRRCWPPPCRCTTRCMSGAAARQGNRTAGACLTPSAAAQ